ncbi:MAG: LOG family protein [Candidatus Nanoarchaeia archaeon]|jgi:hypothetical protein
MNVLIIGYWDEKKAAAYKTEAESLGELLAKNNHSLISGGGIGVSKWVVNSYRLNNGKKYTAYFPSEEEMKKVDEKIGPFPDETIETAGTYTTRNECMIKDSDIIVALPGGIGTLGEIITAVKDYKKQVFVLDKGELASWIKNIQALYEKTIIVSELEKIFL